MKVIENSRDRLVFRLGIYGLHRIECAFDRVARTATIMRTVVFVPLKPKVLAWSDIVDVRLLQVSGSAGEGGKYESSFPMLVLSSDKTITLGAGLGSDSEAAVALIKAFLADTPKTRISMPESLV